MKNLTDLVFWDLEAAGAKRTVEWLKSRRSACPAQLLDRPDCVEPALLACTSTLGDRLNAIHREKNQENQRRFLPPLHYVVVPLTHFIASGNSSQPNEEFDALLTAAMEIFSPTQVKQQLIDSTDETFGITPLSLCYLQRKAILFHPLFRHAPNPTIKCPALLNRCSLMIAAQCGGLLTTHSSLIPLWLKNSAPGAVPLDDEGKNLLMVVEYDDTFEWVLKTLPTLYPSLACDLSATTRPSAGGDTVLHLAIGSSRYGFISTLAQMPNVDWGVLNALGKSPFELSLSSNWSASGLAVFLSRASKDQIRAHWDTSRFSPGCPTLLMYAMHSPRETIIGSVVDFVAAEANADFLQIPVNAKGEKALPYAIRSLAMGTAANESNFDKFVSRLVQPSRAHWVNPALQNGFSALYDEFYDGVPVQFYCALISGSLYDCALQVIPHENPETMVDAKNRNILQFAFSSIGPLTSRTTTGGLLKSVQKMNSLETLLNAVDSEKRTMLHYFVEKIADISRCPSILNTTGVRQATLPSILHVLSKFANAADSAGVTPRMLYLQKLKEMQPMSDGKWGFYYEYPETPLQWTVSLHARLIRLLELNPPKLDEDVLTVCFELTRCGLSAALGQADILTVENVAAGLFRRRDPKSKDRTLFELILYSLHGRSCLRDYVTEEMAEAVDACLNEDGVFDKVVEWGSASYLKIILAHRKMWKPGQLVQLLNKVQSLVRAGPKKWGALIQQLVAKPEHLESLSVEEKAACLEIGRNSKPKPLLSPLLAYLATPTEVFK